ncbi:MAG: Nif11-like leader peptide family RiPP precursor [Eubacterium sp.]|nr:Nif11-like leader peptide family RiPP precursor [Eubacterium sp.]
MKNLEQFYKEVMEDETLKADFISAYKEGKLGDFLKEHEISATAEETMEFIEGVQEMELSDDDLENVAGGNCLSVSCDQSCTCNCERIM